MEIVWLCLARVRLRHEDVVATVAKFFVGRQFHGNFVTSSRLLSVKKPNFLAQAKLGV